MYYSCWQSIPYMLTFDGEVVAFGDKPILEM